MIKIVYNKEYLYETKGNDGDVITVDEPGNVRDFYWNVDHWARVDGYECPIKSHYPEPNV